MDLFGESVYVRLMNEGGVISYRPAASELIAPDIVKLIAHSGYCPEDEEWEFKPGSIVRVATKDLSEGPALVAVELIEGERSIYTE